MKESNINIRVIEPSEGFYLTKRVKVEGEPIVLSKKVILSAKDSPDNWVEITEKEGERLRQEEEEKMNNEQM
jgi:hypothetical protein